MNQKSLVKTAFLFLSFIFFTNVFFANIINIQASQTQLSIQFISPKHQQNLNTLIPTKDFEHALKPKLKPDFFNVDTDTLMVTSASIFEDYGIISTAILDKDQPKQGAYSHTNQQKMLSLLVIRDKANTAKIFLPGQILDQAAQDFLQTKKADLEAIREIFEPSPELSLLSKPSYKFPWPAGEGWKTYDNRNIRKYYDLGGWHKDATGWALDFTPPKNSSLLVLASTSGVVDWACEDEHGQVAVKVKNSGSQEVLRYYHLDKNKPYTSVLTSLKQGQVVGHLAEGDNQSYEGCNLFSWGTHIHLGLNSQAFNLDGYSFTKNSTNMGRPLFSSQDMNSKVSVDFSTTDGVIPKDTEVEATLQTQLSGISKVQFWQNQELVATKTKSPFEHTYKDLSKGDYNLLVRVFDEQGQIIEQENRNVYVQVPECQFKLNQWCADYYKNVQDFQNLESGIIFKEIWTSQLLDKDWGLEGPLEVGKDYFSAIFRTKQKFEKDEYTFSLKSNNGVEIFIDGEKIFSDTSWESEIEKSFKLDMGNKEYDIEVRYFEGFGEAKVFLEWGKDLCLDCQQEQMQSQNFCQKDPTAGFADINPRESLSLHVCSLKRSQIISGSTDGFGRIIYLPNNKVTRAEMSKFVKNAFELKTDTSCIKFVDVDTDHTFFEEIMTLKCMGLVSGNNGKFLPEGSLTRAEATKFIINAKNLKNPDSNQDSQIGKDTQFVDVDKDHAHIDYINQAQSQGIINGQEVKGQKYFRPQDSISRLEIAKIIDLGK
jgi:hypothetical protein